MRFHRMLFLSGVWVCAYLTSGVLILALLTLTLAVVFGWYLWMADREFGGITGIWQAIFSRSLSRAALTVLTAAYWFPAC